MSTKRRLFDLIRGSCIQICIFTQNLAMDSSTRQMKADDYQSQQIQSLFDEGRREWIA